MEYPVSESASTKLGISFGNQGVALMQLAERTKDAAMSETALQQIEVALETMRAAGLASFAAY